MTKAMETPKQDTKRKQDVSPAAAPDFQAMIGNSGETLTAFMKTSEAVLSGMASLSNEVLSFAGNRLRETIATTQEFSQCKDAQQAFQLQCDYASKATQQYLAEASRIMELATAMGRDSVVPLEERTRETLRHMNGD